MSPKLIRWVGGVRCLGLFPKKNQFFFTPSLIGENDFAKYLNFNIPCDFCKGDSKGHNYFMVEQDSSWANYSTEKL